MRTAAAFILLITIACRGTEPSPWPEVQNVVLVTIDTLRADHTTPGGYPLETTPFLQQMAEEGAASVFKPRLGSDWIVGVVGGLQFDVLADRIRTEYDVPVRFESTSLYTARWVEAQGARSVT